MTPLSPNHDVAPRRDDRGWPDDVGLLAAAQEALQSSGYAALRRLHCEVAEAVVLVRGVLPSYYLKQVAQVVLLRLRGLRGVRNLVEVRRTDPVPRATPDD